MSSVRHTLTAAEHAALAATPLPFALIWSEENFDKVMAVAERGVTMTFLNYLLEYRNTLASNNPVYNDESKSAKQVELLVVLPKFILTLDSAAEPDLCAAAYNIYGLLLKDVKQFEAAQQALVSAMQINGLMPLSLASLAHNLALVADAKKDLPAQLKQHTAAVALVGVIEPAHVLDKHIAAAIHCSMGNTLNAIKPADEAALQHHLQAIALWPENNVISNNAAIYFSKQNNLLALQKAADILSKFYDKMLADSKTTNRLLFVTPFYRADVNVKLAGFAQAAGDAELCASYLSKAFECLGIAEQAIASNPNYQQNYRTKAMARCAYLKANAAYVVQNYPELEAMRAAALALRATVSEAPGKCDKFMAKFPQSIAFTTANLFRHRGQPQAPVADEKSEIKLTR